MHKVISEVTNFTLEDGLTLREGTKMYFTGYVAENDNQRTVLFFLLKNGRKKEEIQLHIAGGMQDILVPYSAVSDMTISVSLEDDMDEDTYEVTYYLLVSEYSVRYLFEPYDII